MRLDDIEHTWRSWRKGADNSRANMDIPLAESVDMDNPTETVRRILETKDEDFGPSMTLEEALAHCRGLLDGKE